MVHKDEMKEIAANARLSLSENEVEEFADDLDSILDAFATLDDIDTDEVDPAFHPIDLEDRERDDVEETSLGQEKALANTENVEDGYFVGPRST